MQIKLDRDDIMNACRRYVSEQFCRAFDEIDLIMFIENEDGIVEGCDAVVEVEVEPK